MTYHAFRQSIDNIELPEQFNCPYCYTPHPLSLIAANEVMQYLDSRADWQTELSLGKMFGVLVVRDGNNIGFLAAFSGELAGNNYHSFFVPPIFDFLEPNGIFKTEEARITEINHRIDALQQSSELNKLTVELDNYRQQTIAETASMRAEIEQRRAIRHTLRAHNPDASTLAQLMRESQHDKAQLKRYTRSRVATEAQLSNQIADINRQIDTLKAERHHRSIRLQRWLFTNFRVVNCRGEYRSLRDIFASQKHCLPPAGAGECAAPKLLQFAFKNHLTPICMAEFWYGRSPIGILRTHGRFYPACQSKCQPILDYMLQGLTVAPNRLLSQLDSQIDIVYEDQWLIVVDKPAGMLSEPGLGNAHCIIDKLKEIRPDIASLFVVHRLDMQTSGLLLIAKDRTTQALLRTMFEQREIHKQYVALLEGQVKVDSGTIDLPLIADIDDRPRQKVDTVNGKSAVTKFVVLERSENTTRIRFFPLTGRTHQLRVHSASPLGLDCPIVGDNLYGSPAERLFLHAEVLEFQHPHTNQLMHLTKSADF